MTIKNVIKRDGRIVDFDSNKITEAILKAANKIGGKNDELAKNLTETVVDYLNKTINIAPSIEEIQDVVEKVLIEAGHARTAKEYILYRDHRSKIREIDTSLMKVYKDLTFCDSKEIEIKRENANIDGDTSMGIMLKYGSEGAKQFNLTHLISSEFAYAHRSGLIHIHDLDFYSLTTTCCQIDLEKLFRNGFSTGHGFLREPGEIRSYAALACIAIQSNQNDQHGGQSIPALDYYLAPGVAKTFIKELVKVTSVLLDVETNELSNKLKEYIKINRLIMNTNGEGFVRYVLKNDLKASDSDIERIIKRATLETEKATYQATEAIVHNLNSMHSRAGAQVPFSSINYGTDTSTEGRLVTLNMLLSTEAGLGKGETPIFPIQVFKLKDGINLKEGDVNYDLFKLACRVSAKRLFPTFSNLDVPFNAKFYVQGRVETEVAYMGCRTRVIANAHDTSREVVTGRGNVSFTTINLPRLALEAGKGGTNKFFNSLDEALLLVERQILERFDVICRRSPKNFPFLMGQGVWLDSDKLDRYDDISDVLKHGSFSIGFIGLAETLEALTGKHHGECEEAQKLGLEIVGRIRKFCDKKSIEHKMNFTCLATPAEGLSGRFLGLDRKKHGIVPGITDKDYYTNSFHVPVYYKISIFKKINIEAPYHELCNAGHITYIEMDGDPSKNLEAFEKVVLYMHKAGIGYGAINHPVDRDPVCGYTGIIDDICPRCGRREGEPMTTDVWMKIKGYTHNASNCGACGDPAEEADRIPNSLE